MDEITKKLTELGFSPEEINKKATSLGFSLDQSIKKVASLGFPGVILVIATAVSGAIGTSAPFGTALAFLGGPFGIIGGLGVLGLMTIIGDAVTGYGIEQILTAVYKERRKVESLENLLKEIESLPLSQAMKIKLKVQVIQETEEEAKANSSPTVITIVD